METSAAQNGDDPRKAVPAPAEPLEQRVCRLEDAVAALQDTQLFEEHVVQRVTERMSRNPPAAGRDATGILIDAGRRLLPTAVGILHAQSEPAAEAPRPGSPPPRPGWWLLEAYSEARAMIDMYLDPRYRYRMTWTGRIAPLVLLSAIATTWVWLPGTSVLPSVVAGLMVKVADLVLAFILFKVLGREAHLYRETVLHPPAGPQP